MQNENRHVFSTSFAHSLQNYLRKKNGNAYIIPNNYDEHSTSGRANMMLTIKSKRHNVKKHNVVCILIDVLQIKSFKSFEQLCTVSIFEFQSQLEVSFSFPREVVTFTFVSIQSKPIRQASCNSFLRNEGRLSSIFIVPVKINCI